MLMFMHFYYMFFFLTPLEFVVLGFKFRGLNSKA